MSFETDSKTLKDCGAVAADPCVDDSSALLAAYLD